MNDELNASGPGSHEYLTMRLGNEEYGIDLLKVQEIRGYDVVTRLASAPEFIKGVINLRGNIVPIVDLRTWFRLDAANYDQFTVVIILNVARRVVGVVVDSVSDVLTLDPSAIRPAPEFSAALDTKYITGIGTGEGRLLILVDIERLLASPDMQLFDESDQTLQAA